MTSTGKTKLTQSLRYIPLHASETDCLWQIMAAPTHDYTLPLWNFLSYFTLHNSISRVLIRFVGLTNLIYKWQKLCSRRRLPEQYNSQIGRLNHIFPFKQCFLQTSLYFLFLYFECRFQLKPIFPNCNWSVSGSGHGTEAKWMAITIK